MQPGDAVDGEADTSVPSSVLVSAILVLISLVILMFGARFLVDDCGITGADRSAFDPSSDRQGHRVGGADRIRCLRLACALI